MNKILKTLLRIDFLSIFSLGLLGPIYAIYVFQIGGDILEVSGAWAAYLFTIAIVMYIMGKLGGRQKFQNYFIISGYGIRSIGIIGYLFVTNPFTLFLVQVMIGIGAAVSTPAYDSIYSSNLDKGKYASEWGVWESMNNVSLGLSALAGGAIASFFGFNALFIAMFAISLIATAYSLRLLKK